MAVLFFSGVFIGAGVLYWEVSVHIPIVGMGGVTSAQDVLELMLAGATAVEVGAANLKDPFASQEIVQDLPDAMEKYEIERLVDIIGGAH